MTRTILAILLLVASQAVAQADDNLTIYEPGFLTSEIIISASPRYFLIIGNNDTEVGRFTWNDGVLRFQGHADEAAREFVRFINDHAPELCEGAMRRRGK